MMWRWLNAITRRIFGRRSSLIQLLLQVPNVRGALRNGRGGFDPQGPYDPESRVRAPRRHGPAGRSAAVAVAEPTMTRASRLSADGTAGGSR
jgi:hypothetical protein